MIQNDAKVRGCLVLQLGSNCVLGGGGEGALDWYSCFL